MVDKLSFALPVVQAKETLQRKNNIKLNYTRALNRDTVSFNYISKQNFSSNHVINNRVKHFKRLMNGQTIPKEVMSVLKNPDIPMARPLISGKSVAASSFRNTIRGNVGRHIPYNIYDKIANKVSNTSLDKINVMAIRLNKLKILDNSESFFRGTGECYFISLVTDGTTEPSLLKVETFNGIRDGDDLFTKGLQKPYTLYLSQKGNVPELIDFRFLVMEADKKENMKAAEIIDMISKNKEYKTVIDAIRVLTKQAAPPAAIFTLVDCAIGVIKKVLKTAEDDQLLYYAARFTKDFDELGIGKYDNKYDKVELGYEILAK